MEHCDQTLPEFADSTTNKCVAECPELPEMFAESLTYTCVEVCPTDHWATNLTKRECVQDCEPMYADNHTGRCV